MRKNILMPLAACIVLTGCSGQFLDRQTVDKVGLSVFMAAAEIKTVSAETAENMNSLGEVVGYSCQNQIGVGEAESTKVGAIDQLRIVAAKKGATAISAPQCAQGGFSIITNCWNSWECKASALSE